ncbi:MAG: phosphatase PAP2 family protein [Phycisphaeraceae bacterium]
MNEGGTWLRSWRFAITATAAFALAFIAAHWIDYAVVNALYTRDLYDEDWAKAFRSVGYLPVWVVFAVGLFLTDRLRYRGQGLKLKLRRAALVVSATVVAGLLAELFKMLLRRNRPRFHLDHHTFRSWAHDFWSTAGFGLPSSHTTVAFAGAAAMSLLFPRHAVLWLLAATGCAYSRIANSDHFPSDVILGAFVGCATAWALWARFFHLREDTGLPPLNSC